MGVPEDIAAAEIIKEKGNLDMKLYAITRGSYSNYHICALTASASKAKRLKLLYSDRLYDAEIEEFEDGEEKDMCMGWSCDRDGCNPWLDEHADKSRDIERVNIDPITKEISSVYVFAKDATHAEKKAHDMIAEYKAKVAGLC